MAWMSNYIALFYVDLPRIHLLIQAPLPLHKRGHRWLDNALHFPLKAACIGVVFQVMVISGEVIVTQSAYS